MLVLVGLVGSGFGLGNLKSGTDDKPLLHVAEEVELTVKVSKPEQRRGERTSPPGPHITMRSVEREGNSYWARHAPTPISIGAGC